MNPRKLLPTPSMLVAFVALLVALGGTATAAVVITSKNIKNGSVTSADIKNSTVASKDIKNGTVASTDVKDGSLVAKDFKSGALPGGAAGPAGPAGPAGATGAKGSDGAKGADGAPGLSALTGTAPAGTVMRGLFGFSDHATTTNDVDRSSITYPAALGAAPTSVKVNPGPSASDVVDAQEDTTNCAGTFDAPAPAAGYLCLYLQTTLNIEADSLQIQAGNLPGAEVLPDRLGFHVVAPASSADSQSSVRGVWAVNAP